MGTTVTTNLGLIKPDGNESIKEALPTFAGWAAQNATNMDKIDALFRASFHTYTPTWTATTTNPTIGAGGAVTGKYLRLWPRMVIGHILLNVGGAGALPGSGTYNISSPVAIASELATFADSVPVGKAAWLDSSAVATSSAFEVHYNVANANFYFRSPDGGLWTDLLPVAIGQQDKISAYFMYPTSAA